jgi:alpha-glucoside transport system permease protein
VPRNLWLALLFLAPALVLLGALVVYPIVFTVVRSLYDRTGDAFVGVDNYVDMFDNERTRISIRNNLIWVVVAPIVATGVGLVLAVLSERIRWQTAFKVSVFMPMAISGLAAGVIFRLVYDEDPDKGVANAVLTTATDFVREGGEYEGARPSDEEAVVAEGRAYVTRDPVATGEDARFGLVGLPPDRVPENATRAREPDDAGEAAISGVVWLDFTRGGGGERGEVDSTERGLPGMEVEALRGDEVAGSATAEDDGSFVIEDLERGDYTLRLAASNFREPFGGFTWLGDTTVLPGVNIVTLSVIASWLWIWIGFSMIVVAAGLAAIPRDVLEAARVDGATEWQVFRRVTAPLLTPVLLVVLVTLTINVLKIFDLVLIVAPGSVQDDASVIALDMWRVSFGSQNEGLGSALAILLFLLVVPAMAFNIRRFRSESR